MATTCRLELAGVAGRQVLTRRFDCENAEAAQDTQQKYAYMGKYQFNGHSQEKTLNKPGVGCRDGSPNDNLVSGCYSSPVHDWSACGTDGSHQWWRTCGTMSVILRTKTGRDNSTENDPSIGGLTNPFVSVRLARKWPAVVPTDLYQRFTSV